MSLHIFNSINKSWNMYTHTISSISGDHLTIKPHDGKNITFEVSGNNSVFIKHGDVSHNLSNLMAGLGGGSGRGSTIGSGSDASLSNVDVSRNLNPLIVNGSSIGLATKNWANAYVNTIYAETLNTYRGDKTLALNSDTLLISGELLAQSTLNPLLTNRCSLGVSTNTWSNAYIRDLSAGSIEVSGNILPLRDLSSNIGTSLRRLSTLAVDDLSINKINGQVYSASGPAIVLSSVSGDIIPVSSNLFKLGDVSRNWSNAYLIDVSVSSIDISLNLNPLLANRSSLGVPSKSWGNAYLIDASISSIDVSSNLNPLLANGSTLGLSTRRWGNAYLRDVSASIIDVSLNLNPSLNNGSSLGAPGKNWGNAYIRDVSVSSIDVSSNLNPLGSGTVTVTQGTGGTVTTSGGYIIHSFTTTGTSAFVPAFSGSVEVLIVGGGGGGGGTLGGGGGAGGVIWIPATNVISGTSYPVVVGTGGPSMTNGQASSVFEATAAGGGTSGTWSEGIGTAGGSGGGAAATESLLNTGGASSGNSLGLNSGFIYGNRGGNMTTARTGGEARGAGGGGAGGQGLNTNTNITGNTGQTGAGSGGVGVVNAILGPSYYWGGGGGGGGHDNQFGGWGGLGGGGGGTGSAGRGTGGGSSLNTGISGGIGEGINGGAGGANTGGGGGGASFGGQGGTGGSGIVVIRYLQSIGAPNTSSLGLSTRRWGNAYIRDISVSSIDVSINSINPFLNNGSSLGLISKLWRNAYFRDLSAGNIDISTSIIPFASGTGGGGGLSATGGTVTTSGAYTIHSFTTVGTTTFTVTSPGSIDYIVVAGGGGGGVGRGGGGGAGGVKAGTTTLSAGSYTITVGAGGASVINDQQGGDGGSSSIGTLIVTTGGGGGGGWTITSGRNGGSGGGASAGNTLAGGTGISGEGFAGSTRLDGITGGGGGGAGAAASGKDGAIGISSNITGTLRYYAGGGGAGAASSNIGVALGGTYAVANGTYGGGNGMYTSGTKPAYTDASANTGGGGGGGEGYGGPSGAGGSGIVVIRYLTSSGSGSSANSSLGLSTKYWGNAYIRDVSASTIELSGNIIPSINNTLSLGSALRRWNNVFVDNLNVSTINGATYTSGGGGDGSGGVLSITSDMIPSITNTYDLGSTSRYWNNAYINNLRASNRAYQEISGDISWSAVNGHYVLAKDAYPSLNPLSSGVKAVQTWSNYSNFFIDPMSVCWSPKHQIFVCVSHHANSRGAISRNGRDWTTTLPYTGSGTKIDARDICWSPELEIFVVVSSASSTHAVVTSPDGVNWNTVTTGASLVLRFSVCWSAEVGIFVSPQYNSSNVIISKNGINWNEITAHNGLWRDVCWCPELKIFVAVGGANVMTSNNGTNWNIITTLLTDIRSICWSKELGIFVAVSVSGTYRVMTSKNGINWDVTTNGVTNNEWSTITWCPQIRLFIVVAIWGNAITSNDGNNWTFVNTGNYPAYTFSGSWSPELGIYIAIGEGRTINSSLKGRPPTSYNVFDSSFNSIDQFGKWTFQSIYSPTMTVQGANVNSDDRLKHNEVVITNGLDVIDKLNPKFYKKSQTLLDASYNGDLSGYSWSYEAGLIAQEVLQIPDLSFAVSGGDYYQEIINYYDISYILRNQSNDPSTNYINSSNYDISANYDISYNLIKQPYALNYNSVFTYGIAAIKELHAKVKIQETTNLDEQLNSLIEKIEALEHVSS
jgi:hypothetical protein